MMQWLLNLTSPNMTRLQTFDSTLRNQLDVDAIAQLSRFST
jgi:hypothetical protein